MPSNVKVSPCKHDVHADPRVIGEGLELWGENFGIVQVPLPHLTNGWGGGEAVE